MQSAHVPSGEDGSPECDMRCLSLHQQYLEAHVPLLSVCVLFKMSASDSDILSI